MRTADEDPVTLALRALGWIAGHDGHFAAFLGMSGASREDILARADDPVVLAAVLDFLLSDDALVLAFCREAGLAPEAPGRARARLPGTAPHWT